MSGDLYAILGIPRTATAARIKSAFRKLAKKFHPDRNPGDAQAEAKYKEIVLAYEILSDPARRARYDQAGDVTKQVNGRESQAIGVLLQAWGAAFQQAMERGDPKMVDLIAEAKKLIVAFQKNREPEVKKLNKIREALCDTLTRLTVKDGKANILLESVQGGIAEVEAGLAQIAEKTAVEKLALEMLDDYSFRCEKPMNGEWKSFTPDRVGIFQLLHEMKATKAFQ